MALFPSYPLLFLFFSFLLMQLDFCKLFEDWEYWDGVGIMAKKEKKLLLPGRTKTGSAVLFLLQIELDADSGVWKDRVEGRELRLWH